MITKEDLFVQRCLDDTGFLARHVLGYNYDYDDDGVMLSDPGAGGIRATGPHKLMVDFLDDESTKEKHLEAPRGSYKTTLLSAFVIRHILRNPNIRILYTMATKEMAKEKLGAIRDQFRDNQQLIDIFGDQLPKGCTNTTTHFTVAGRTIRGLSEYTVQVAGADKPKTGGHYEIIILDDLVEWSNVTPDGIEKVLTAFKMARPLLMNGGLMIVVGTRYNDGDLYGTILGEYSERFDTLILDAGVEPVQNKDGTKGLTGEPSFAHLSIDRLGKELDLMSYEEFCSQYLNRIVGGTSQPFRREQFQTVAWEEWMEDLSVYVVTDTAASEEPKRRSSCHSVVGAIGIDQNDHFYLLDLRVGFFSPTEYETQFMDVFTTWSSKCHMRGITMETNACNTVFRSNLNREAERRGLVIDHLFITIARGSGLPSKGKRIMAMQSPFENGQFHVLNTLRRNFTDLTKMKVLFDPEGYIDPDDQRPLPAGELVNQFIRHGSYTKDDIADAIADILAVDSKGVRRCRFHHPRQSRRSRRREKRVGDSISFPLTQGRKRGGVSRSSHWEEKYKRIFER